MPSAGAANNSPSPGGIQLLGFAQRSVRTSRSHIPVDRRQTKPYPTTPKTLGDHIKAKRFEKELSQAELAGMLGVRKPVIQLWEHDRRVPTVTEQKRLVELLGDLNGH